MKYKPILIASFLTILLFFSKNVQSQQLLIKTADTVKIYAALKIIKEFEPEIYFNILTQCIIQFGIIPDKPTVNFAISDEYNGEKRNWILLNQNLMNGHSNNIIATIIVHEAMHLGYNMGIYKNIESDNEELVDKQEHTVIYNYELVFLKKIGASTSDIKSRKQIMKQLSIPII